MAEPRDVPPTPATTGDSLGLDRFVGKVPVVLCFTGPLASAVTAEIVRGFDEHHASFGRSRVQALVVASSAVGELDQFRERVPGTVPVLADEEGTWRRGLGVSTPSDREVTLVYIAADGHVLAREERSPAGVVAEESLARVDELGMAMATG